MAHTAESHKALYLTVSGLALQGISSFSNRDNYYNTNNEKWVIDSFGVKA
jgi:hypothetical protein